MASWLWRRTEVHEFTDWTRNKMAAVFAILETTPAASRTEPAGKCVTGLGKVLIGPDQQSVLGVAGWPESADEGLGPAVKADRANMVGLAEFCDREPTAPARPLGHVVDILLALAAAETDPHAATQACHLIHVKSFGLIHGELLEKSRRRTQTSAAFKTRYSPSIGQKRSTVPSVAYPAENRADTSCVACDSRISSA